jgi:hypothetical protein
MDNTTNINDLPIDPMEPIQRPMEQIERPIEQPYEDTPKKVRFSLPEKNKFLDSHKILLLACLFFLLFSDTKVKIYLMNILVVIFGDALRTTGGGSTKIGQVFYTCLYGLTLWSATLAVEWSKV